MTGRYRPVPWRRNVRKVPIEVSAKLNGQPATAHVAGVVKTLSFADIEAGRFQHLGLALVGGAVTTRTRITPAADMGRYSRRNRDGWEIVRRDLPKIWKTISFEVPNFGDWSKGSHSVDQERLVYEREFIDPPTLAITIEKLAKRDDAVIYRFAVDVPLIPRSDNFERELLFALNLLQENLGQCGVIERDAAKERLVETLLVDWEIFPAGTSVEAATRIALSRMARPTAEQEAIIRDRLALFGALGPRNFIRGTGGMNGYIGALFADDLVVFENVRHGNALYVLYENWKSLSQESRIDLIRSRSGHFDRFPHRRAWKDRFVTHLKAEKVKRGLEERNGPATEAA